MPHFTGIWIPGKSLCNEYGGIQKRIAQEFNKGLQMSGRWYATFITVIVCDKWTNKEMKRQFSTFYEWTEKGPYVYGFKNAFRKMSWIRTPRDHLLTTWKINKVFDLLRLNKMDSLNCYIFTPSRVWLFVIPTCSLYGFEYEHFPGYYLWNRWIYFYK